MALRHKGVMMLTHLLFLAGTTNVVVYTYILQINVYTLMDTVIESSKIYAMHILCYSQVCSHRKMQTHTHTHTHTNSSKPSKGAHQSGNAITQSKYSLPPLFSHTAKQLLKLPSVADQQSIHKQEQMTLPPLSLLEDISLMCQEDTATGYNVSIYTIDDAVAIKLFLASIQVLQYLLSADITSNLITVFTYSTLNL